MVSINSPSTQITSGETAYFTATVSDDRDSSAQLVIEWAEFEHQNGGCDWVDREAWGSPQYEKVRLASDTPYEFTAKSANVQCLCVRATDHDGASSQACQRIAPVYVAPTAVITDASGAVSGAPRALCSQIHLSAENSVYPEDDQIEFKWTIDYSGTDSNGTATQLAKCEDIPAVPEAQHRCFYAAAPGSYTVTLTITDATAAGNGSAEAISQPVAFSIPVNVDAPPCLQRTDPEVYAQRILLATCSDPGSTCESRTFKVLSATDDCEPYPVPAGSAKQATQFVWSVYDAERTPPAWVYQADTTNSFTVSHAMFPGALRGDEIKVRVEVRDAAVQQSYLSGFRACASEETDICCGANACAGSDKDCIRWTTWTVQFQP